MLKTFFTKMTMMDILEFRDINRPAPKGKTWTN